MKVKIKTMEDVVGLYDLGVLEFEGYGKVFEGYGRESYDDNLFHWEVEDLEEKSLWEKDRSARRNRRRNARAHARKVPQELIGLVDGTDMRSFLVSKKKAEKANHEYKKSLAGKKKAVKRINTTQILEAFFREMALDEVAMRAWYFDKMDVDEEERLYKRHVAENKALKEKISSQREEADNKVFHKMLELASVIKECNEDVFVHFDKKQIIEKVSAFLEETL